MISITGTLFVMSAVFPIMGVYARRRHDFYARKQLVPTLNGLAFLAATHPDEYAAIRWLNEQVSGTPVIVEAVGDDYLYRYARISANTGLPTILGWPSHADQREHWGETYMRRVDVNTIYESLDLQRVLELVRKYRVTYIYIGHTERQDFSEESLNKFAQHPEYFDEVFRVGNTRIYQVR